MERTVFMSENTEPIVRTTEECFKTIDSDLAHYTTSNVLGNIFCDGALCLKASCFSKYWKAETTLHDDADEFRGALRKINWKDIELLHPCARSFEDFKSMFPKIIPASQKYDFGPINGLRANSTLTPYFICFSSEINNENMYRRFCNSEEGVPVMIRLNAPRLLEKGTHIKDHPELDVERQIILNITYYEDEAELEKKNLIKKKAKEVRAVVEQVRLPEEREQLGPAFSHANCEGDNCIEACLLLKKKVYDCEKETRYILFTDEQFNFGILKDGQFDFRFDDYISAENAINKKLFLNFPSESVESVQFGPEVSYEQAKQIVDKSIFNKDAFKKLPVYLFDGTQILPDSIKDTMQ